MNLLNVATQRSTRIEAQTTRLRKVWNTFRAVLFRSLATWAA